MSDVVLEFVGSLVCGALAGIGWLVGSTWWERRSWDKLPVRPHRDDRLPCQFCGQNRTFSKVRLRGDGNLECRCIQCGGRWVMKPPPETSPPTTTASGRPLPGAAKEPN